MNSPHDRDEASSKGDMEALHMSIEHLGLINIAEEDDSLVPPWVDDFSCDLSPAKIDGPDETQTKDGGVTGGNFSSSADQQTLGNAQGSENSFLRQSLAWNTAFFTEQGVLDPYELAEYTNTALPESPPDPPFPKCKTSVVSCHQLQGYTSSSLQERSGKRPSHQTHRRTHSDFIEKPMKRTSAGPRAEHRIKNQQPEATSQKKTCVSPANKRTGLHNDVSNKQSHKRHISLSSSTAMTRTSQGFNTSPAITRTRQGFNTQHKVCEKPPLYSKKVEPGDRSEGNSNKKVDNLYSRRVASQPSGPMPSPVFNARAGKELKKLVPNQPTKDSARNVGSLAKTIFSVSRCVKNKVGKVLAGTKTKNTDGKHPSLIPKDNFSLATAMSGASSSVCQRAPVLQRCHSVNAAYELRPASNMKSGGVSHAPELCTYYTDDSSSIFHSSLSPRSSFDTFSSQNSPTQSFSPMTSPLRKGHISSERDHLLPLESLRAEIQCAENSGITSNGVDSVGYDPRSFPSSYKMLAFDKMPCTTSCKVKSYALKPSRLRLPSPKIGYFDTANISFLSNTCNPSDKTSYSAEAKPLANRETLTRSTKYSARSEAARRSTSSRLGSSTTFRAAGQGNQSTLQTRKGILEQAADSALNAPVASAFANEEYHNLWLEQEQIASRQ